MISTQCIILCGGENSRWKGYRNTHRKHLIEIKGELLLDRTLRLVTTCSPTSMFVVVNKRDLNLYNSQLSITTEFYGINPTVPHQTGAYKFLSSKELWSQTGRTIVLLGDVWFSEEAIVKIFDESTDDWTAFGRAGDSKCTGKPYGELFAQRFISYTEHEHNLMVLNEMYLAGTCRRSASGWAHYQLMIGADPNLHTVGPRFVEVDDFTEDFDCPEDFNAWHVGRSLYGDTRPSFPQSIKPIVMSTPKIGRNDLCPCGSGKKFKKCCGQ